MVNSFRFGKTGALEDFLVKTKADPGKTSPYNSFKPYKNSIPQKTDYPKPASYTETHGQMHYHQSLTKYSWQENKHREYTLKGEY